MPSADRFEEFDYKAKVFRSRCPKKLILSLERIDVIEVLDLEGKVVMTFQKQEKKAAEA